jgi:hypothetical protein
MGKFSQWFALHIDRTTKTNPYAFQVISYAWDNIRISPGVFDELQFLQDIYNKSKLTVEFVNVVQIQPLTTTAPKIQKYRIGEHVPIMFDPDALDRHCLLHIPLGGYSPKCTVNWVNKSEKITDDDMYNRQRTYAVETVSAWPNRPVLMRSDQAVMYNNSGNSTYWRFVQVGFEANPTYEEVKSFYLSLV